MVDDDELVRDLAAVLNHHSADNEAATPDFILAEYLVACLGAYTSAKEHNESWRKGLHEHGLRDS